MRMSLIALAAVGAAAVSSGASGPAHRVNSVVVENRKPGTSRWEVGWERDGQAQGYTSEVSVGPGESVQFHVSLNPAGRYRIEIYRLGWYQGFGGRLYTCLPSCTSDELGSPQPVPSFDPGTGYLDAGWPVTDVLHVGTGWLSGYYLGVIRVTSGADLGAAYRVPFIVRAPASRRSSILVQASTNTWEAYNAWGGRSLYYPDQQGVIDNHVSFDRPYDVMPMSDASESRFELPLLRFLERNGYDVAYQADSDTDADPGSLMLHRLVIVSGHDEYWTQGQRAAFSAAVSAGVNVAFMGGDIGYWRVRYANNRRTIVEYRRYTRDPDRITDKFRRLNPPEPECQLEGVQFDDAEGSASIGTNPPLTVADPSDPWFADTGLKAGDSFPNLAGGEWDNTVAGCTPPGTVVLLDYLGVPSPDDVTRYTAPSGAIVFSASSLNFNFGLDDPPGYNGERGWQNRGLQRFTRNAFNTMTEARKTRPARQTRAA